MHQSCPEAWAVTKCENLGGAASASTRDCSAVLAEKWCTREKVCRLFSEGKWDANTTPPVRQK